MSLSSPGVHLFYHSRWQDTRVLDELCWGLEEQGVPCRAICCNEHDCALALSKLAAKAQRYVSVWVLTPRVILL